MTEEKVIDEKVESGPKVFSKKNIADQYVNFSIFVGEMKCLPVNYEKSELIKKSLKVGDLVLVNNQINGKKNLENDVTLDKKDQANFLNQNTSTVIKQLRINDLSNKDLKSLLIAERKNKNRTKIMNFIKSLQKVI